METRQRPTLKLNTTAVTPSALIRNEIRRLDRIIDSLAIPSSTEVVLRAELIAVRANLVAVVGEV